MGNVEGQWGSYFFGWREKELRGRETASEIERGRLLEARERPLSALMASYNLRREREKILAEAPKKEEEKKPEEKEPEKPKEAIQEMAKPDLTESIEEAKKVKEKADQMSQEKRQGYAERWVAAEQKNDKEEKEKILRELAEELGYNLEEIKKKKGEGFLNIFLIALGIVLTTTIGMISQATKQQ